MLMCLQLLTGNEQCPMGNVHFHPILSPSLGEEWNVGLTQLLRNCCQHIKTCPILPAENNWFWLVKIERSKARAYNFPATTPISRALTDRSGRTERL